MSFKEAIKVIKGFPIFSLLTKGQSAKLLTWVLFRNKKLILFAQELESNHYPFYAFYIADNHLR